MIKFAIKDVMTRVVNLIFTLIFLQSCATVPYTYQGELHPAKPPTIAEGESQISRGEPNIIADSLGHYFFSLPEKLILWNWNMGNHDISPETEAFLADYLKSNDLTDVKIRLNEYAPLDEFSRLTKNNSVGAGWRYTLGILVWAFDTILPGRIFGGDNYNPFTNSVNLYSDHIAVALHEAGHAKDFAGRNWKGSYAAFRIIPLVPLYNEAIASDDAVSYLKEKNYCAKEVDAYKVLYPAYSTYIGGELVGLTPVKDLVGLALVIPGHIAGRIKASNTEDLYANNPACSSIELIEKPEYKTN